MPHLAYYWTRFPQGPVRHVWCRALLYSEAPSGIPLDKFSLGPCPAYMWGTFILKGPIWHTIRQVFLRALSGICICRPLLYSQGLSGIILDEFYLGPCLAYTYAGHIYTEAPSGILLDKLSLGSCPLYIYAGHLGIMWPRPALLICAGNTAGPWANITENSEHTMY